MVSKEVNKCKMLKSNTYSRYIKNFIHKNNILSTEKIICSYRYASWALTSIFYFTVKPYNVLNYKVGVIFLLFVFSLFINNLYIKIKNNKASLRKLVLIETLGIEFLLLPSGGLTSPFIWYALNPIITSAIYLSSYFSWVNLIFYLVTGSIMSSFLFNPGNLTILQIYTNNSNLILVFILINLAIQLLTILNKALNDLNIKNEESIEHIMSLYQMIETLNNHSSKEKLFEAMAGYTGKLTKSNLSLIWLKEENLIKMNKILNDIDLDTMLNKLNNMDFKNLQEILNIKLLDKNMFAVPIISTSTYYGVAAVEVSEDSSDAVKNQNIKLLKFISDLSSVILDRFNMEGIEEHLLVMEEQNRIADEMHDSVSQRLFSISYGIHGILGRLDNLQKYELEDYLLEMRESSNIAMKELRKSIYRLSSRKKGEKYLQESIQNFLDSITKLQDVIINFHETGDENLISFELKKGLTRIIREACGNAIRHGKCSNINIELSISLDCIRLSIKDDGNGFVLNGIDNKGGLGLSNMRALVNSFNGSIDIESTVGCGTNIQVQLPIQFSNNYKESLAI